MTRNNEDARELRITGVGISVINLRAKSDFQYANKLVEYLGACATGRHFVLIGREGQEGYFIPAPRNFSYVFRKLHSPISKKEDPKISGLLREVLSENECRLLVEFGPENSADISLPTVSIINSFEMFKIHDIKSPSSPSPRKLKFVNRASHDTRKKPRGIIFSSPYLHAQFSRISAPGDWRGTSICMGTSHPENTDVTKTLEKYGIDNRFIISLLSSAGMKESLRLLKAYRQAFEEDPNAPDLILIGTEETPSDVCTMLEAIDKSPLNNKIKYTGIIPDEDLSILLKSAHLLVFPSEIFNCADILVTAMESGCAILCANRPSSVEITCDAALYFDPVNWKDLAFKMKLTADDEDLSNYLKTRSETRARIFSKEEIANRLLDFFDDIISDFNEAVLAGTADNSAG